MSAREDLAIYLAPLLRGAFLLDSDAQALAGARALVGRLTYVVDDCDEVETTSLGGSKRSFIRNRWITVKVPNGVEHATLPYEDEAAPDA